MIPKPERDAFTDWLIRENGFFHVATDKAGERWYGIKPLLFHWTLETGAIGDYLGYETRWCYADKDAAVNALWDWHGKGWAGEPGGWRRHPDTSRRRNDQGDPASEWIET